MAPELRHELELALESPANHSKENSRWVIGVTQIPIERYRSQWNVRMESTNGSNGPAACYDTDRTNANMRYPYTGDWDLANCGSRVPTQLKGPDPIYQSGRQQRSELRHHVRVDEEETSSQLQKIEAEARELASEHGISAEEWKNERMGWVLGVIGIWIRVSVSRLLLLYKQRSFPLSFMPQTERGFRSRCTVSQSFI